MATLSLNPKGGYWLKSNYNERQAIKAAGGRWDADRRCWRLPEDADLRSLAGAVPLFLTPEAKAFLAARAERERLLASLHLAEDASLRFPVEGLSPYQRVGAKFLATAGRAILADDMGLGKTAQAVRACEEVGARRVLVVCPKSLLYNWEAEIGRWGGDGSVGLLLSSDAAVPEGRYIVTNYEAAAKHVDALLEAGFEALIVDEATRIKNRKTARTRTVWRLAEAIRYVWLLTGTPIHNQPGELWSLLHSLSPDYYSSYWRFVERYCVVEDTGWGRQIVGVKDLDGLARELGPRMLRRTKELLHLPPLSFETVRVRLGGEQARIYRELETKLISEVSDGNIIVTPSVLSQLTRLRQVACTPALIGGPDEAAKTETLLELLEDLAERHKVLVFTTFAQYVEWLFRRNDFLFYKAVRITGEDGDKDRWEAVRQFQEDPECRVLIGTIGAMGEGLNLQAADVVIFLNKDWVPATNEQAVARAYRRGQEKPVHVISLEAANTVDQHVEALLARKKGVISQVEAAEAVLKSLLKGRC